MPHARCTSCGQTQRWKAGKGCRLADLRCEECGGELRALTAGRAGDGIGSMDFRLKFDVAWPRREIHRANRPRVWYFRTVEQLLRESEPFARSGRLVATERRDPETRKWVAFDLSPDPTSPHREASASHPRTTSAADAGVHDEVGPSSETGPTSAAAPVTVIDGANHWTTPLDVNAWPLDEPVSARFGVGDRVVHVNHLGHELPATVLNDYDGGTMVRVRFDDRWPLDVVEIPRSFLRRATEAVA